MMIDYEQFSKMLLGTTLWSDQQVRLHMQIWAQDFLVNVG
jgi:hypothetical protein